MLYLKYYGAIHPPIGIQDLVEFEDVDHPSKEGFNSLLKTVFLNCESEGYPREDWDKYLQEEIKLNSYAGMKHIGGVCKTNTVSLYRPWDIEISENEYNTIRKNIESENASYKERLMKENERLNDPNRQGLPEHQELGWRSRAWVLSYTVLERHIPYALGEQAFAYCRIIQHLSNGTTTQLIDIYHGSSNNLEEVMLEGFDLVEWFIDLLAFLGFGSAQLIEFICTSPTTCREGVPFTIAAPVAYIYKKSVRVSPSNLDNLKNDRTPRLVVRSFREGFGAFHPATAIGHFWNSVEQTAHKIAKSKKLNRLAKCENCGFERKIGLDLKTIFREFYAKSGIASSAFDFHRKLRGKVQHGAHLKTSFHISELLDAASQLQTVAAVALVEEINIKPQAGNTLNYQSPITKLICEVKEDQFTVKWSEENISISHINLPEQYYDQNGRTIRVGFQGSPPANPLFIPPIIE